MFHALVVDVDQYGGGSGDQIVTQYGGRFVSSGLLLVLEKDPGYFTRYMKT